MVRLLCTNRIESNPVQSNADRYVREADVVLRATSQVSIRMLAGK